MLILARLTFLEGARKKVFLAAILLALVFLTLYAIGLDFAAREFQRLQALRGQQPLLRQIIGNQLLGSGLYFASFLMTLLAMLAGVGAIAAEIETGLLDAVVSKPLPRRSVIVGKFAGHAAMIAGFGLLLYGGVLLLNGLYNGKTLSLLDADHVLYGAFLFVLQPLALLAAAMLFSTLLRPLTAGIVTVLLYVLASVGGFLEQIGSLVHKADLVDIGIAVSLVIPIDALFRKLMTVLTVQEATPVATLAQGPFGAQSPPSGAMVVYATGYLLAALAGAVHFFEKKDL
ncbi:ABC transporter permease subunit [Heliobacterium gestii]|uniref:ABC transporter permease subunit n=1 Tax=Heliomicrobium gestii TaxID=2699 RepID=A0A845LD69_HELGE|nr:ABC transporter permease subunit [Heliomicrobium gestii]MBM7866104.1 ABC-type transport system involved in multi-copper enzyme maturation permease subunit [Heliomicrobium gestii]MZP42569.1 ABC transporter permease subunit [Heliomicrobium gestii]